MSSDGCSLYALSHERDLEKSLAKNQLEVIGETEGNLDRLSIGHAKSDYFDNQT
ncbi:hypothetical protein [Legionella jamestowniensis]|uniref:hypothetical protein n=1 Tax=Legionella jamestowniensis TaxID=455 RepID=UPI000B30FE3F|nr:hypothetical protein [Legionella jamestowniensis]